MRVWCNIQRLTRGQRNAACCLTSMWGTEPCTRSKCVLAVVTDHSLEHHKINWMMVIVFVGVLMSLCMCVCLSVCACAYTYVCVHTHNVCMWWVFSPIAVPSTDSTYIAGKRLHNWWSRCTAYACLVHRYQPLSRFQLLSRTARHQTCSITSCVVVYVCKVQMACVAGPPQLPTAYLWCNTHDATYVHWNWHIMPLTMESSTGWSGSQSSPISFRVWIHTCS